MKESFRKWNHSTGRYSGCRFPFYFTIRVAAHKDLGSRHAVPRPWLQSDCCVWSARELAAVPLQSRRSMFKTRTVSVSFYFALLPPVIHPTVSRLLESGSFPEVAVMWATGWDPLLSKLSALSTLCIPRSKWGLSEQLKCPSYARPLQPEDPQAGSGCLAAAGSWLWGERSFFWERERDEIP